MQNQWFNLLEFFATGLSVIESWPKKLKASGGLHKSKQYWFKKIDLYILQ